MYFPRGDTQECVKCAKGWYLDMVDKGCKKAEFPITDCVDMVKIGENVYCNVCQGGFPSEEYAFTACSKFSTNEVVGTQTTTLTKPPKGYLDYLAKKESYLMQFGHTVPSYMGSMPNFSCKWGAINSQSNPICARCLEGYTVVNGICTMTQQEGCLMYDSKKRRCWFCDVYSGYYGLSNRGWCKKFNENF